MSKDQSNTSTQAIDPGTRQYIERYRQQAQQAYQGAQGQPPPNPYASDYGLGTAQGAYSGLLGNLGLAGQQFQGASSLQPFLNPYQSQVTDAARANFDRQRQQAIGAAGSQAAGAGAYGGSRSGILQAQALNDVNQNETGTLAGLNQQGYTQALNAWQQQQAQNANLGLAGAQGLAGIGGLRAQGTAGINEQQRQYLAQLLGMQQGGFGPTSQTNSQTQTGSTLGTLAGLAGIAGGVLTGGASTALTGAARAIGNTYSNAQQPTGGSYANPQFAAWRPNLGFGRGGY